MKEKEVIKKLFEFLSSEAGREYLNRGGELKCCVCSKWMRSIDDMEKHKADCEAYYSRPDWED